MSALLSVLTLFFGSFLLFGIQPMLGRTLLPAFGGSAAVWTVCLAAYQVLLLAGYGYAHALTRLRAQTQRRLHFALLALSILWTFGFAASRLTLRDRLGETSTPSLEVLLCVLVFIGLPYVLLSANSTLIQAWLSRARTGSDTISSRDVYKLYAVSNLGSLVGLLVYPFLLEPFVPLTVQWYGFAICMLLYMFLLIASEKMSKAVGVEPTVPPISVLLDHAANLPQALTRPWLWLALPALGTFLLNTVTTHLSTDVSPVPLMWVLLLTVYLFSYILGFSVIGEKGLIVWASLSVLTLAGSAVTSGLVGERAFVPNLVTGVGAVLVCCTFLHSWLYRIRPDASQLTRFYLGIAAGGALGGVSSSLLAPMIFDRVWEYPLGLIAACVTCAWLLRTWNHPELKGLTTFLLIACSASGLLVVNSSVKDSRITVARMRNFYGCLRVERNNILSSFGDRLTLFKLRHGETLHGFQIHDRLLSKKPSTYYGPKGGGLAITQHPKYGRSDPMRVCLIGLGAGTMASYGRTNDVYRFFEINPHVITFATNTQYFTYITDSAATIDLVLGDARKRLEHERFHQDHQADVLVVDAYSGDSVPFHLATREAFQLYLDRLAPDGILAIHISNWHIDLLPLCKAVATSFGLYAQGTVSPKEGLAFQSHWVFFSRKPLLYGVETTRKIEWNSVPVMTLPTDDLGSLLPLVRFGRQQTDMAVDVDFGLFRPEGWQ